MKILVIDGQGGKMGAALTEQLLKNIPDAELIAVGTNSMATAAMLRAGAHAAATGENPVIVNSAWARRNRRPDRHHCGERPARRDHAENGGGGFRKPRAQDSGAGKPLRSQRSRRTGKTLSEYVREAAATAGAARGEIAESRV